MLRLALVHSFVYLLVTPILIGLSIALAIVVNRRLRGIHIYRALYFVPAVSGSIAIGLAWRWLFERSGFINSVLLSWGVIHEPIQWLATPSLVLPIAMLLTIWAGIGYYSVIFLAGLQNVPEELYDAARIDGCNDLQKHWYVSIPALRPQIVFVGVISSLAALKVFDEIYVLTGRTGGILNSGVTMVFYLWQQAFERSNAGYASAIAIVLLLITLGFSIVNVRLLERGPGPRPDVRDHHDRRRHPHRGALASTCQARESMGARRRLVRRAHRGRRHHGVPVRLDAADVDQGPRRPDHLGAAAVPAERPDACGVRACLGSLPIANYFLNSTTVAIATGLLNMLVAAMAAYPLAKMQFAGREFVFYLLLATLIVPAQLTYIPSFILAVNVFHYYDSLPALIFPNIVSAFNIFLLRQAFRGVPDELVDAARVDGAGEWRIWWSILLPIIRPSLAAVAIFTFVTSWNDFLWPSLMLHTPKGMTLPVGLAALQGFFSSDFRSIAAGVTMTVVPILLFFVVVQRYFVRGLSGAVKG